MNDFATSPAAPSPAELLAALVRLEDRVPFALIEAATAHGDDMVSALSDLIDDATSWEGDRADELWWPLHAALVLGRIPTQAAGLLLVRLLRAIDEHGEEELLDWLAGDWVPLFANKPQDAIDAACALAQDTGLGWYTRCQALGVILDTGRRGGDAMLEAAIDRVAAMAADTGDDWLFRSMAASSLLDFPRQRHRALLERLVEDEIRRSRKRGNGPGVFDATTVEHAFAKDHDDPIWQHLEDPWAFYTPEAIAARQQRRQEEALDDETLALDDGFPITHVRATPKRGRNDPCHCGSGKKYKRCCLAKDEAIDRDVRASLA